MLGCHENVTVVAAFAINCEQKVNKEEKLTRPVSPQLADPLRKTPAPAKRD
jgi:hypothetical protein